MIEKRKQFIKEHGFKTLLEFSYAVNDNISNISKVIRGTQKPKIEKLFHWCEILHCDIIPLLDLFYPDEMQRVRGE